MNPLDSYLQCSQDIIGERTADEQRYDEEVIQGLKRHGEIRRAIQEASGKYPTEALKVTDENVSDVAAHYEYLMNHIDLMKKMAQAR